MKGTRWSFGHKLENGGGGRFIFMPQESIKVKYRVLEMVQATAYGDNFRIQIQQKPVEENRPKKSSKSVSGAVGPEMRAVSEEQKGSQDEQMQGAGDCGDGA